MRGRDKLSLGEKTYTIYRTLAVFGLYRTTTRQNKQQRPGHFSRIARERRLPTKVRQEGCSHQIANPTGEYASMQNPLIIGLIVFGAILVGAFAGFVIKEWLPKHHLSDETKSTVSVSMAVVA